MKYIQLIFISIFFITHSAQADNSFNKETLSFVKNISDGFTIKPFDSYKFTWSGAAMCAPFTIDYKNKRVTFEFEGQKTSFNIITQNISSKILGEWFENWSDDDTEVSTLTSRTKSELKTNYVDLNHKKQTYITTGNKTITNKYIHFNDFIIVDVIDNGYYNLSFVTSLTENKFEYMDCLGSKYSTERYTGQKLLDIPESYTKQR